MAIRVLFKGADALRRFSCFKKLFDDDGPPCGQRRPDDTRHLHPPREENLCKPNAMMPAPMAEAQPNLYKLVVR